jgi:ribose transport system permease protein
VSDPAQIAAGTGRPAARAWRLPRFVQEGGSNVAAGAVLLLLVLLYAVLQPSVLTPFGLMTLADEYTALALAAIGETLVVLVGGLDLSVGAILSLVNVILVVRTGPQLGSQVGWAVLGVVAAMACGLLNGAFVALLNLPSIVVTLATMFIWTGVALLLLPLPGGSVPEDFVKALTGSVGGVVPVALLILLAVCAAGWFLGHTKFGISMYAVGGDEDAATAVAIRTRPLKLAAFALAGLFYGLAGVFLTAQSGSGDPNIGAGFLLEAFAAVAVGGTPFGGGRGALIGSVIGAFILGTITNVLFLLGVSSFATPIFYGLVLLAAMAAGAPRLKRAAVAALGGLGRRRGAAAAAANVPDGGGGRR